MTTDNERFHRLLMMPNGHGDRLEYLDHLVTDYTEAGAGHVWYLQHPEVGEPSYPSTPVGLFTTDLGDGLRQARELVDARLRAGANSQDVLLLVDLCYPAMLFGMGWDEEPNPAAEALLRVLDDGEAAGVRLLLVIYGDQMTHIPVRHRIKVIRASEVRFPEFGGWSEVLHGHPADDPATANPTNTEEDR